ncbi:CHAT domain-containing protein [Kitasatospora sp. NPDC092948]|uniref:CHAT domain-containing protein n=1 Tax=Kitasatospora sp. NPDC092948 TaxID=3364088 RepID=UPI003811CEAD
MTVDRDATAYGMRLVASRVSRLPTPEADLLLRTADVFRAAFPDTERHWAAHLPFRLADAERRAHSGDHDGAVSALRALHAESPHRPADLADRLQIDERLARALLRRDAPGDRQAAFDLVRQRHAALLAHPDRSDTPTLTARHRSCYALMIGLLLDHGPHLTLPAGADARELAFDLHEEYRARTDTALHATGGAVHPATLNRLRAHLAADPDARHCAYVSYFHGEHTTVAFVLHADTGRLTAHRTPLGEHAVRDAAQRLRHTFDGDPDAFPPLPPLPVRRPWRRDLAFFDDLAPHLLAFLPDVTGRELLCLAAEPALQALPLPALPLPTRPDEPPQVLAHRHAVVHVSHATALLRTAAREHPGTRDADAAVFVAGVAAREDADPQRLEGDAEFVTRPGLRRSELRGVAATPHTVLTGLAGARVAHLSGHGWYDRIEPLDSGLLLAHAGQRPSKYPLTVDIGTRLRHLLTARQILDAGLRPDLLTLRACSTARQDLHSTGDLQGLARLLQTSGARTVLATLWDVDDTSSRRLYADFHRRLATEPPWRALLQAQCAMLDHPAEPWERHPYHWAATILLGDWRTR